MAGGDHLTLDPAIRDWVVLPLMAMVIMVGFVRHYLTLLLQSEKPVDKDEFSLKQTLTRARRLRSNANLISRDSFLARKAFFTAKEGGVLRDTSVPGPANPMADPTKMMDPMKSQMGFIFTNIVMMTFISHFFAGFVLVRVPFPLTNRFKVMLQRGVELSTLDASYVSSLSWYFLVMFGMRALIDLCLGGASASGDEASAMQAQMGMGAAGPVGFDAKKAFSSEADSLDLTKHVYALEDVEKRLLGIRYPTASLLEMPGAGLDMRRKPSKGGAKAKKVQ